jgi:hypothetical protein
MNAFTRIGSLLAVALVLSFTGVAEAGVNAFWQELGGSASGNGLSQLPAGNTSASPSVAVGADGRPVVTYVESGAGNAPASSGPQAVDLLSAGNFAILAGSTVTNTGSSIVTGDLGLSPGSAVTGFPPGTLIGTMHVSDPTAAQAKLDLTVAYNDAAGRTTAPISVAGDIGGLTLAPGLYKSTGSLSITGNLTLDAQGDVNAAWIFQIASTLDTAPGSQVILSGGAQAKNVFWQVGTSATLGTTSIFKGTILADQSITLNTGATLDGRALARIAAVNLDGNAVTSPGGGSGAGGGGGIIVKRWTGTAWETLSGLNGIGQGFAPQIRISSTGTLYVAWLQDEDTNGVQVHLLRRTTTSSAWVEIGGSDSPGGLTALANGSSAGAFSLAVGADGNPVVAFDTAAQTGVTAPTEGVAQDESQVYVRRYNGSNAWDYLGSDPSAGGGASNAQSLVVEGTNYAIHFAGNPSLAVQGNGTLAVAFQYGTAYDATPATGFIAGNTEIFVTQFSTNTSTWTALGPAVPTTDGPTAQGGIGGVSNNAALSGAPALAIRGITLTSNEIWVAWLEGNNVFARRFDSVLGWVEFAGSGSGDGISDPALSNGRPDVVVDTAGDPVVVWSGKSSTAPRQIFVKRNDSGSFTEMGQDSADAAGISDAALNAFVPMVDAPPSGTAGPAVIWLDQKASNSQVFLRQFTTATAFTLNVSVAGGNNTSTVSSTPIGISCPGGPDGCTAIFPRGQVVSLVPQPGADQKFIGWGGSCTGAGACNVTMSANRTVTATFASGFTLNVSKLGDAASFATITGTGITCGTDCSEVYLPGTAVTLSVSLQTGTLFSGWGGDCAFRGSLTTCPLTMSAGKNVSATFTLRGQLLTITRPSHGTVVSTNLAPDVVDCGTATTDCSTVQDFNTLVNLQATADTGFVFANWTGTSLCSVGAGATNPTCSFQIQGNVTATPNFRAGTAVTLTKSGNGMGTVTAKGTLSPATVSCGPTCTSTTFAAFDAKPVALTATAAVGSRFVDFTGDCMSTSSPCSFIPAGANDSVNTQFVLRQFTLRVLNRTAGTVTSTTPSGIINCGLGGSNCTQDLEFNTQVVLVATPNADAIFVNWTGAPCNGSANATCAFRVPAAAVTLTPNYRARTVINVAKTGNGSGLVTSVPAGINCGTDCTEPILDNVAVKLTAAPSLGSSFAGFSGACVSNTSTCTFVPAGASQNISAQFVLQQFTLTTTNRPEGSVASTTPSGIIDCGSSGADCTEVLNFATAVSLQATPTPGFVFTSWTGDAVCSGKVTPTCSFPVPNRNFTVTPNYRPGTTVTLTKSGTGHGTVAAKGTLSPTTVSCGPTCTTTSFSAFDGNPVALTATPVAGSRFVNFSGDCQSNSPLCTFIPGGANDSVNAQFVMDQFTLRVTNVQDGTVASTTPSGVITCGFGGSNCTEDLDFNTSVVLVATPNADAVFVNWTGTVCNGSTSPTCSFSIPAGQVALTPNYRARTVINVVKTGNGSGLVTSVPLGINCGTDCTEPILDNVAVKLTAAPSLGSSFTGFSGACVSSTATCTFVPGGASQNVSAQFVLQQFGLSVTNVPTGEVTSTTPPGAIDCGATGVDCTETLNFGTSVTLAASPNSGAMFINWTGDAVCSGKTTLTCTFTMPNRNVSVSPFYRVQTIVNVVKTGTGQGMIASTPAGITCGTDCSQTFFDSTPITLTATPVTGSDFLGFSGVSCLPPSSNTSTVCRFVPVGNTQNIGASFTLESRTVNLTVNGDGAVMSGPFGCDASTGPCAFTGDFGSQVVFTATPGAGNRVLSQTGCTSMTTGTNSSTCTVILNQTTGNKSVTVTFSFLMAVSQSGNGTGTVASTPAGINCGADCSEQYAPGTSVLLNRTPAAGSSVGNWGGDCAFRGFNASCTLAMTQNQVVSAGFSLPLTLTVTKLGSGNGSVTSSPSGITCGADCTEPYAFGTPVTLTASAASGSIFGGFGVGNCDSTPTNVSCQVSMTSNRTVTASFTVPATGVSLGSAATFAGLGGAAGLTNQGLNTVINGNIGTTGAATLITGFHDATDTYTETPLNVGVVNGTIFSAAPAPGTIDRAATAAAAVADATTAFNNLSPALMPGGIDLGDGELGGRTLAPGVYKSAPGTYDISLGDLTLDGQGDPNAVWVFQMASTLTVGIAGPTGARSVILINGAQAQNVFWQVGSHATINGAGGGTMVGTIIASAGVSFSTAGNNLPEQVVTLNGRALGLNASVTLVNTVITVP